MLKKIECALLKAILLFLMTLQTVPAWSETAAHMYSIVLLQPEGMVGERVAVKPLADYINDIETEVDQTAQTKKHSPVSGFIVVAVKPGKKSKAWLDMTPALDKATERSLLHAVQKVPVIDVRDTVVFAITTGLWGGQQPKAISPSPTEWGVAAHKAGRPMEVTELVESIWPN